MSEHFCRGRRMLAGLLVLSAPCMAPPAEAQTPAALPMIETVAPGRPMPIDGVWRLSSNGRRLRIERGRSYAVDSWVQLFVLEVEPGMVLSRDIEPTGPANYELSDLLAGGRAEMKITAAGTLNGVTHGVLGPTPWVLTPVRLDHPGWFRRTMQEAGLASPGGDAADYPAPPPPYAPPPPSYGQPPSGYAPVPPGAGYPAAGYRGAPTLPGCTYTGYYPETGQVICLDRR